MDTATFILLHVSSCKSVCKVDSDLKSVAVNTWFLSVAITVSSDLCTFWPIPMVMTLMPARCNWSAMTAVAGGSVDWPSVNTTSIFGTLASRAPCAVVKLSFWKKKTCTSFPKYNKQRTSIKRITNHLQRANCASLQEWSVAGTISLERDWWITMLIYCNQIDVPV